MPKTKKLASEKALVERLTEKFPQALIGSNLPISGTLYLRITPNSIRGICQEIFNLGARFVTSVATDRSKESNKLEVNHIFSFDQERLTVVLKAQVSVTEPTVESISSVIPGANWSERECADMMGIEFSDHPDSRRLILADDWPQGVHPLRKSFPYNYKPPAAPENAVPLKTPESPATVLPIGPFYPVLEEPAYFRVFVEGEEITGCDYRGFYNHRGIEKLGDSVLTYNQVCFLAERICGICGYIHSTCYCQAIEQAARIEVPPRARFIRTLLLELERIHSHLLWFGIAGHIIGFDTILMQAWRIREPVMWLCELITGNRKTYGMNLIGGVRRDITKEQPPKILEVVDKIESQLKELINAAIGDTTLHLRLKNVGILTRATARQFCPVGPTVRGSGIAIDSRANHPYAAYAEVPPRVITEAEGDIWARTIVRLRETLESINLVRQTIKLMPNGEIMADVKEILPWQEGIAYVEAPRGECIHYVITGPDNRPYRWRVRAPSYANLQSVPAMLKGYSIADAPIIIGSIDPCFSCTERLQVVDTKTKKVKIYTQEELRSLSRKR